jgi:hypothetical protein
MSQIGLVVLVCLQMESRHSVFLRSRCIQKTEERELRLKEAGVLASGKMGTTSVLHRRNNHLLQI